MMRDSASEVPGSDMSVDSDDLNRQPETVAGTGNPTKWPDWGIYNYKAVIAYDGTNYKYVSMPAFMQRTVMHHIFVSLT